MDTDSFIVHVKPEDITQILLIMFKKTYDTTNYEDKRPLPIEKNKKKVGLMKDEFGGKIMKVCSTGT